MTSNILWVDDVVKLKSNSMTVDGKLVNPKFTGNNYNWIVTEYDPMEDIVTLGAFSAFGKPFAKNPPIVVHRNFVEIDESRKACRHPEIKKEILSPVSPTCTTTGLTRGSRCTACGKILKEQTKVPEIGHIYEIDNEQGTKICVLCKHEDIAPRKNVELKKNDIRAMIKIIENMLNEATEVKTPQLYEGPYWDANFSHTSTTETYNSITYTFFKSSLLDTSVTSPYKLPLIIWFGNENTQVNSTSTSVETIWWDSGNGRVASHVLVPKFSGNFLACKKEFFNLLEQLTSKYYVDPSKIVLMGEGEGGAAVQFFMYQDPDKFSYQVIIDGTSVPIDFNSIKDLKKKTMLYSRDMPSHMTFLSSLFDDVCRACNGPYDAWVKLFVSNNGSVISDILSKNNDPIKHDVGTYTVKDLFVALKTSPSTYAENTANRVVFRGQRLLVDKLHNAQNYVWGKLDSKIWKTEDSDTSEMWIPLECMFDSSSALPLAEYVVPCCFDSYGMMFVKYYKNYTELHHNGIDLITPVGTPVFACRGGEVKEISRSVEYGVSIKISNSASDDTYIQYSHLTDPQVEVGEEVRVGTLIGYVGETSASSVTQYSHLHIGIKEDGVWVNPEDRINFHK